MSLKTKIYPASPLVRGVFTTATLPSPAAYPLNTVIVNSDTNQILINYTTSTWSALS